MDGRRRSQKIFLWVSGLAAIAVLVVSAEVLLPFVLGLLVAYVLLPAVLRVEQMRVPRWAAILLVYAATLGAIGGFIALVVPSLVSEGQALRKELPATIDHVQADVLPAIDARLRQWTGQAPEPAPAAADTGLTGAADRMEDAAEEVRAEPERPDLRVRPAPGGGFDVVVGDGVVLRKSGDDAWHVQRAESEAPAISSEAILAKAFTRGRSYVTENAGEVIKLGQKIVSAISRGIFVFFMMLMLGGYIMLTHERILAFFRDLIPFESQDSFDRLLRRLDRGLSGVVRGQLLICVVNGVLSAIGFWLFDLKYWPIMSVIAAVGSLIPIFGSILSTIPAVAIGLTQSPGTAFAVLAWVVGIHQLEANFLNPKIIGDSAKIHPVLVVFSLLVGEHFFQIKGALFAVPCMSIAQTFFLHFREVTMGLADPMASIPPAAPVPHSLSLQPAEGTAGAGARNTPPPGGRLTHPTPLPRTRPSPGSTSIDTTLPAGTRREDVLADEDEAMRDTPLDEAAAAGLDDTDVAPPRRPATPTPPARRRDDDPEA